MSVFPGRARLWARSEKIMEQDNEDFHRHWEADKLATETAQNVRGDGVRE